MKKKILSLLTAFAMVFGILVAPFTTASADNTSEPAKPGENKVTKTVTVHKILMDKEEIEAKKVTVGQETKVIIKKDGKFYDGKNPTVKLQDTDQFVQAYESAQTKVFVQPDGSIVGLDGNEYDGNQIQNIKNFFGQHSEEIENVYFVLKFAADYKDTDKQNKYVKAKGATGNDKLTPADPLEATENIDDAVGGLTGTGTNGVKFDTSKLSGKFEIDEVHNKSTYQKKDGSLITGVIAVPVKITLPLVNNKDIVEDAHVYPKNLSDKPQIDKNFVKNPDKATEEQKRFYDTLTEEQKQALGADYAKYTQKKGEYILDINTVTPYEVKTQVPANSHFETARWEDIMTAGLTYNKDLSLEIKRGDQTLTSLTLEDDFDLKETDSGFQLELKEKSYKKLEEEAKKGAFEIILKYSSTVNGSTLVDNYEKNNVTFTYGNNKVTKPEPKPTKPSNGKITVNKTWSENPVPTGVKVTYNLWEKGANPAADKVVASVITTGNESVERTLPSGIKFKATANYGAEFSGLDDNKDYYVTESVQGYAVEYTSAENGVVKVKNNKTDVPPLTPTTPEVSTGGKRFEKTDYKDKTIKLGGATFVISKQNKANKTVYLSKLTDDEKQTLNQALTTAKQKYDAALEAYNKRVDDNDKTNLLNKVNSTKETYFKAFKAAQEEYKWIEVKETTNAQLLANKSLVKLVSSDEKASKGAFEITGLEYGNYKLHEVKAPADYALTEGQTFDFTVGDKTYGEVAQDISQGYKLAQQQDVPNKKVDIPQTGGIGSLIFIVAGAAIMIGAFVAYKKSQAVEA